MNAPLPHLHFLPCRYLKLSIEIECCCYVFGEIGHQSDTYVVRSVATKNGILTFSKLVLPSQNTVNTPLVATLCGSDYLQTSEGP